MAVNTFQQASAKAAASTLKKGGRQAAATKEGMLSRPTGRRCPNRTTGAAGGGNHEDSDEGQPRRNHGRKAPSSKNFLMDQPSDSDDEDEDGKNLAAADASAMITFSTMTNTTRAILP